LLGFTVFPLSGTGFAAFSAPTPEFQYPVALWHSNQFFLGNTQAWLQGQWIDLIQVPNAGDVDIAGIGVVQDRLCICQVFSGAAP
jgi:hypothetical protein